MTNALDESKLRGLPRPVNLSLIAGIVLAVCGASCCFAQSVVALTPPMGWNSWNHFADHVADALVSTGMRAAGYVYVNIDDTWQGERDAQGVLHSNQRFPDMKALGDYIHSK